MSDCDKYSELISLMCDGELSEPQKTELEAHIKDCRACRRCYDAFTFISSSIDEGLAQPPEGLCRDVMACVASQRSRRAPARRRGFPIGRLAALAACLAVVIFAASRINMIGPDRAGRAVAQDSALTAEESGADAACYGLGSAEPVRESSDESENPGKALEALPSAAPELSGGIDNGQTGLTTAISGAPSLVRVFSGEISPADTDSREPIVAWADDEAIGVIMDMLAFSEDAAGLTAEGTPTFLVEVTDSQGGSYSLSVWIIDGRLCCVSSTDGALYVAAGDISELIALVAAA